MRDILTLIFVSIIFTAFKLMKPMGYVEDTNVFFLVFILMDRIIDRK